MSTQLSAEFRLKLLHVARRSLKNFLKNGERIQFSTDIPELLEKRAVFVTLRKRGKGNLRGCIGQFKPSDPLIEAVSKTAISAAIEDKRFSPLTIEELPDTEIGINVLSPLEPSRPEDVEIGKHGLMINKGSKGALFLPEVAVTNGWDLNTVFGELCRKADLPAYSWLDREAELYVFESDSWGEHEYSS